MQNVVNYFISACCISEAAAIWFTPCNRYGDIAFVLVNLA